MLDHRTFIRVAASFEAALAVLAVLIGWAVGIQSINASLDGRVWLIGVVATLPLIAFYYLATWIPFAPLRRIHTLLLATLGQPLSRCRWHELALLACLAGICEELLFRGVLQPWIGRLGEPAGWIGANLLFGIAHAVTPTYFILATGIGFYFSAVQSAAGGLAAPIVAHSLYDWFAFVQIAAAYRRSVEATGQGEGPTDAAAGDASG